METGIYGFSAGVAPLLYDLWLDGGNGGLNGQLALEIKAGRSGRLSTQEAAQWFDSLRSLQAGSVPVALVILDPWQLYLRLPVALARADKRVEPVHVKEGLADYVFESAPSLAAFVDTARLPLPTLRHDDLLLVVSSWLSFLMSASAGQLALRPADAWIVETGLHRLIAGGTLQEIKSQKVHGGHTVR